MEWSVSEFVDFNTCGQSNHIHSDCFCTSSKQVSADHQEEAGSAMCVCVCVCVCVCMYACVRVCVCVEVMRNMLNEVLQCVYVIKRVHCALGCLYILLTLLFLYCVLRAHCRCKRLTDTLSHYVTLQDSVKLILQYSKHAQSNGAVCQLVLGF